MSFLSKEQILGADDRKYEEVHVPEWGGSVLVRSMTGKERDKFEASTVTTTKDGRQVPNLDNLRARLISLCVVDEDHKLLFNPDGHEVQLLGNKSTAALQRIFNACQRMNGITDSDLEEMTENFEQEPPEPSTSD